MTTTEIYRKNRPSPDLPILQTRVHGCNFLLLLVIFCLFHATCALADQTRTHKHARLDWVPQEQLTEAQQKLLPTGCCGTYISPPVEHSELPLEQTPIDIQADSVAISREGIITLEGNVELNQGVRQISAARVIVDRAAGQLQIENNITVREDGLLIHAQYASMNINSQDAELNNTEFVLHQSRIHGSALQLKKQGGSLIRLIDGAITTCTPDNHFWSLEARNIDIYSEENYGIARHARLKIKGVPVLYLPYLRFPIGKTRQSGLLYPAISESQQNGFEYSQPVYWNIAPQADMTLTPRYMSKRGLLLDVTTRYKSPLFDTELSAGYLHKDRGGYNREAENSINNGVLLPEEAYPFKNKDRWMVQFKQVGQLSERLKTQIDYTDLSDNLYLLDMNSSDLDTNRAALTQKLAKVDYAGVHWTLGARAQEFRALNESRQKPYREMPRVHANGLYRLGQWELGFDHEYARFDLTHNYTKATDALVTGDRFRTHYGIRWNKEWTAGFLKPYVGVKTLSYRLHQATFNAADLHENDSTPSLVVPQVALDMGLIFERTSHFGSHPYIQTLEPRLFYFYSKFENHDGLYHPLNNTNKAINFDTSYLTFSYNQLFRTTRFAGGDRIDDANQLATGITSRFISPSTGIEHLRLSLGQIYRFDNSQVALNPDQASTQIPSGTSEYAFQASARLGEHTRLSADMLYNQHTHELSDASASLQFMSSDYSLINLSYRYSQTNLNVLDGEDYGTRDQLDASVFLPISPSWSLIARSHYDFTYKRELDTFAGFEYNNCCYKVRFVWRRWLDFDYNTNSTLININNEDYDQGFFFDLQLKGLGDISKRVGALLSQTITGYSTREKHLP